MKRIAVLAAFAAFPTLLMADAPADPLAPAHQGLVQCYDPNIAAKTCRAIGAYTFESDGTITYETTVALPSDGNVIIMKTKSPVTLRGDAVCGPIDRDAIKTASLTEKGRRLPADDANQIRVQLQIVMAGRFGKESCATYQAFRDASYAKVTLDGVADSDASGYMRWVKPDDGYTVVLPSQ
jgi:hypothetical protein